MALIALAVIPAQAEALLNGEAGQSILTLLSHIKIKMDDQPAAVVKLFRLAPG